jgi:PAS domain S-box-containing protein
MSMPPTEDRLFKAVFEGTLDALCLADDEGVLRDVNDAAATLFGLPDADLVGRGIDDFTGPELDFDAVWATLLDEGEMRGEFDLYRPDGEVRTVEFAAKADVLPGIHLSSLRDVTEQASDRAALVRKTELLAQVFEASPVGIAVIDADGEIVDANQRAESILGVDREEIIDRRFGDMSWHIVDEHGDGIADEELPPAQVLSTGETVFGFEHGLVHPSGEVIWLSINAAPIRNDAGEVEQVVAVFEDITDEREYRRLLEQQNERLEEYSATVSHDLRSPLSVASGWIDIAIEEESTADLDKAKAALKRMEALIADLRALGRYGQTVRGPVELDVEAVATEAWTHVETVDATLDIEAGLGNIHADEGRLLQLFENLFGNAVEHAGPNVAVRVGPVGGGFYVEDDGPGIPADKREEVFEFGYSTREGGSGLGLAIVEAVADAHGWTLTLTDADPQGTRFEFRPRWHPDLDD